MADNTTADPGAGGDVFATDDVGGVHYPYAKLAGGTLNSSQVIEAGGGTEAAALRVTVASDSTGVLSVDDNGGSLTVDNPALSVVGGGLEATAQRVTIATDSTGVLSVDDNGGSLTVDGTVTINAIPAGTNNIGDVDVLTIAAGTNAIGNVGIVPRTTGGATPFRFNDIDETEEEVKGTAGQVFGWSVYNDGAGGEIYFHIYNATAANVTVGTTTPLVTLGIPAGGGANAFTEMGIAFGTAITIAATTAHDGTGAPAANQVVGTLFYA
jgi:hypothetical protein